MNRIGLIAKREFSAFSDGATFWVALLFGPAMALIPALAAGVLPDSSSVALCRQWCLGCSQRELAH